MATVVLYQLLGYMYLSLSACTHSVFKYSFRYLLTKKRQSYVESYLLCDMSCMRYIFIIMICHCWSLTVGYFFAGFVPYLGFRLHIFGHAHQVRVTTTYSTAIRQNRRSRNQSAFRTGIAECWIRPLLIVLSVIIRFVLMRLVFYCMCHFKTSLPVM